VPPLPARRGTSQNLTVMPDEGDGQVGETLIRAVRDDADGAPAEGDGPGGLRDLSTHVLRALRHWVTDDRFAAFRLAVVTTGAADTGEGLSDLAAASVWGLVRSAQAEHPGRFVLADIDELGTSARVLRTALSSGQSQFAIRDGRVLVPRLRRSAGNLPLPDDGSPWRVDVGARGTIDGITAVPSPEMATPLGPEQVRVAIRAVGLNFRDVMITLGMYPGSACFGGEAAGVVVEAGRDVLGLAPGDRVMGLFPEGATTPTGITDHLLLAQVPDGWSFTEAAAFPVAFLTAWYGLRDLAGLSRGESLLLHTATGGVGMAATQLARHWGAEIYATASPGKWDRLRELGFDDQRISTSRTLDFEPTLRERTGGRGFDVVLHSLAHEFTDASLRLAAPGGRFIDMGKTDIRDPADVAATHPGVHYKAFDVMDAGRDRIHEMLTELSALAEAGTLRPLPTSVWPLSRTRDAIRHLSQARHTGKLALRIPTPFDGRGTVLITGGTGTLGAMLARHLVERHHHDHLLLVSRRGLRAPGAEELRSELAGRGASVIVEACDVANRDELAALLASVPANRPLTAVIHAAGLLDDAVLTAVTPEQLTAALRVKAESAWLLHELTANQDLAAFILFSSLTGTLGNAGQASYAAANAYLDALAHYRRQRGLPANSIAWGLWTPGSGMTGHLRENDVSRVTRSGLMAVSPAQGLSQFDAAVLADLPFAVPANLNTTALRERAADGTLSPLLLDVVATPRKLPVPLVAELSLRDQLASLPEAGQRQFLLEAVRRSVVAVLGHSDADAIRADQAFKDLGFDSLTAIELRNRLSAATGLRLSATLAFDYPSPTALADHLHSVLRPDPGIPDILAAMDRVETELAGVDADLRGLVTRRLRAMVRKWDDSEADDADLATADDDELFEAVDQLGGLS
jgi:mycoketide-CoA synthase